MDNKKSKIIDVKQKLHNPVKPKKKSHIGEYFAEILITILFLGSIAITVYKYTGRGKFIKRTPTEPVSINDDGSVGFNTTNLDGNSTLEIYSEDNNVFDISSYSDMVAIDFKSKSVTPDDAVLGKMTVKDTEIFRLKEQEIPISGQAGGKILFGQGTVFPYNLDSYGRFKGSGILQNISPGGVFSGGFFPTGCKDVSLQIQTLVQAKSMPKGYLSDDKSLQAGQDGIFDNYIPKATGVSGTWNLLTTPFGTGILLNSTNIVQFPITKSLTYNSIVLPPPGSDGDFINFLFVVGPSLTPPSGSAFNVRNLSFRCTNNSPFSKNCLLRSINFQLGIAALSNGGNNMITYNDISSGFYDNHNKSDYIENAFMTSGKSNIIFLNVFSRNDYVNNKFANFNADGTTIKFVSTNQQWAVEGNSYSDSGFFTQKTGT